MKTTKWEIYLEIENARNPNRKLEDLNKLCLEKVYSESDLEQLQKELIDLILEKYPKPIVVSDIKPLFNNFK